MATKGKVSPSPKEKKVMSSSSQPRKSNGGGGGGGGVSSGTLQQRKSPSTSKHASPVKRRQQDSSSTSSSENKSIPNYLKPTISSGRLDPSSTPPATSDHKLKRNDITSCNSSSGINTGKPNITRRRSFDRPLLPATPTPQSQKARTSSTPKERSTFKSSSFTARSPVPLPDTTKLPLKSPNKGLSANSLQGRTAAKKKHVETGGAIKEQDIIINTIDDLLDTDDEILRLDDQLQDDQYNSSPPTINDHQHVLEDDHDTNSSVTINSSVAVDVDDDRRDPINVVEQKQEEREVEIPGSHDIVEGEVKVVESSYMGGDNQEPATNYNQIKNPHDHDVTALNTQTITETVDDALLEEVEPKEDNIAADAEVEQEQEMVHKERDEKEEEEEESVDNAAETEHVEVENEEMKRKQHLQQKQQQETIQGKRKESNSVSNDVIEETATKLREQRKNKVKALAGAFETVISLQETK